MRPCPDTTRQTKLVTKVYVYLHITTWSTQVTLPLGGGLGAPDLLYLDESGWAGSKAVHRMLRWGALTQPG